MSASSAFVTLLPASYHHAATSMFTSTSVFPVSASPLTIPRATRRRVAAPRMQSAVTVALEIGGLSAGLVSAYNLWKNVLSKMSEDSGAGPESESEASLPNSVKSNMKADKSGPTSEPALFTAGLAFQTSVPMFDDQLKPIAESNRPRYMTKVPPGHEITSVGVVLNLPTDSDEVGVSMPQQYEWAASQLATLEGCDGILIIDTKDGNVLAQAGLLLDAHNPIDYVGALPSIESMEVCTVADKRNWSQSPLFDIAGVKSFANTFVGTSSVAIVLLSTIEGDFIGEKEKMLITLVSDKLKALLDCEASKLNNS